MALLQKHAKMGGMTDDPYGSFDEAAGAARQPEPKAAEPVRRPLPEAEPIRRTLPNVDQARRTLPEAEQLGYQYQEANTEYGYGPPQQGAYGVPFYGQPQATYQQPYQLAQQPLYGRPLLDDPTAADAPLRGATPLQAYKRFWTRGVTFTGRASQSEYWWIAAIHGAGMVAYGALSDIFSHGAFSSLIGTAAGLYFVAALVPFFALNTRRLHDTDQGGTMQLLGLIPIVGWIIALVLMAQPPKPNGARYDRINLQ